MRSLLNWGEWATQGWVSAVRTGCRTWGQFQAVLSAGLAVNPYVTRTLSLDLRSPVQWQRQLATPTFHSPLPLWKRGLYKTP